MKRSIPPPSRESLLRAATVPIPDLLSDAALGQDPDYHPWEWFTHHEPPAGFTREDWWLAVRLRREQIARPTPFTLRDGTRLTYNLPDRLLRLIEDVSTRARGEVALPEPIANPSTRNRYLISSLTEEAITSSQLEGASTSRMRAKEMLREGRNPQDRSEQMILNNYGAMQEIIALKDEPLSPELIREIHRRVTTGTLDDPADAGRIQRPGEERVRIYGTQDQDQILHVPPPAEELPGRMETLCAFANSGSKDDGPYMPPLLRAITLHFMMGHDHYFAAQYARSFLLTEDDDGDLTYFYLAQARIITRAIDELEAYLARKTAELQGANHLLRNLSLNHRQIALIERFLRDPGSSTTVMAHQTNHDVATQTARTDLQDLERRGYLESTKQGRRVVWFPIPDLAHRLDADRPD